MSEPDIIGGPLDGVSFCDIRAVVGARLERVRFEQGAGEALVVFLHLATTDFEVGDGPESVLLLAFHPDAFEAFQALVSEGP